MSTAPPSFTCPACGAAGLQSSEVLWPALVEAWQLSAHEVAYVNRQQGTSCSACHNNLRTMALARALLAGLGRDGTLAEFCASGWGGSVLEINRAGLLTGILSRLRGHRLVEYPAFDMQRLDIPDASQDVVLHSDTLEHVPNPLRGLEECRRVLRPGGLLAYTVPVIVDRLGRRRDGLPPSHHGAPGHESADQVVHTEFGADFWQLPLQAGFANCRIEALEYPAALAIVAVR